MNQLRGTPLKRFLRDWRRAHPPRHDLVLVLQSVAYPVNVGSLFRIADGVNASAVYLCGITAAPPNKTISKVGRNKDRDVRWEKRDTAEEVIAELRAGGYHIVALEITDEAQPYYAPDYPQKVALVLGNEDHGVTRAALALCDTSVFVPMLGKGKSLNVHISAAVALYHIVHQRQMNE